MINWSALVVFLLLGVIGIWVAYSFLNKNGLCLFSILATMISMDLSKTNYFNLPISSTIVIFPIVFLAFLTYFKKYGKDEAKKMFIITLIAMVSVFSFKFFEAAYIDSSVSIQYYLTWSYLGNYISSILAFAMTVVASFVIVNKLTIKKLKSFLQLAIYIAIASSIYAIVYTVLAYTGLKSFGDMLLIILLEIVITSFISLLLGYFEKYLNREPKSETKKEEKTQVVVEKVEETPTYNINTDSNNEDN